MILLLGCSAFFSGSETALFNLSRRQINLLKNSKNKFQNLAAVLLLRPGKLLGCLLFGNMAVNILFYALASVLAVKIQQQAGSAAAAIGAFVSFAVLVIFGEVVPKSLAYANSRSISAVVAVPLFLAVQIFGPIVFVFRFFVVEPVIRLLPIAAKLQPVTTGEFKMLIGHAGKRGLITEQENRLIGEIVELGFLKVRHVMQPRVDIVLCDVNESHEKAFRIMKAHKLTKVPVYSGAIDNIIGLVYFRQLLLRPRLPLKELVEKICFVPEQKTVESLLQFFRVRHTDIAVAVDEYGGIAGLVRLEDIAEELLGPIETTGESEPVEKIGPFTFRLAGSLAVHDWAEAFGLDMDETRVATLGGLVTALLGKIPEPSDTAYLRNLKFTVERVRKRRIETVILTFEPIDNDN